MMWGKLNCWSVCGLLCVVILAVIVPAGVSAVGVTIINELFE